MVNKDLFKLSKKIYKDLEKNEKELDVKFKGSLRYLHEEKRLSALALKNNSDD